MCEQRAGEGFDLGVRDRVPAERMPSGARRFDAGADRDEVHASKSTRARPTGRVTSGRNRRWALEDRTDGGTGWKGLTADRFLARSRPCHKPTTQHRAVTNFYAERALTVKPRSVKSLPW